MHGDVASVDSHVDCIPRARAEERVPVGGGLLGHMEETYGFLPPDKRRGRVGGDAGAHRGSNPVAELGSTGQVFLLALVAANPSPAALSARQVSLAKPCNASLAEPSDANLAKPSNAEFFETPQRKFGKTSYVYGFVPSPVRVSFTAGLPSSIAASVCAC